MLLQPKRARGTCEHAPVRVQEHARQQARVHGCTGARTQHLSRYERTIAGLRARLALYEPSIRDTDEPSRPFDDADVVRGHTMRSQRRRDTAELCECTSSVHSGATKVSGRAQHAQSVARWCSICNSSTWVATVQHGLQQFNMGCNRSTWVATGAKQRVCRPLLRW